MQIIGFEIADKWVAVMLVMLLIMIVAAIRFKMVKNPQPRAKCTKCKVIFDASHSKFGRLGMGPFKQVKCPACGKLSIMYTMVKMDVTWPPTQQLTQTEAIKS